MKLYITKWALTSGIIEIESDCLKLYLLEKEPYYYGKYCKDAVPMIFYIGKDITDELKDAEVIADNIRMKKIMSLKKQIEKLESKNFISK